MTTSLKSHQDAVAALTGPGSPFELRVEDVRGVPTRNFVQRPRSIRELVERAMVHGDAELVVQGDRRVALRRVRAPGLGNRRSGFARRACSAATAWRSSASTAWTTSCWCSPPRRSA